MKGSIKRGIPVAICLFSLLLCCCANQQQEKKTKEEKQKVGEKVTQGLATEGTWNGVTYQYNEDTGTLTVSGKIIKGVGFQYWEEKDELPWGKWREDAKELVLEEGVECVTGSAFREFRNLEKIVFPNTLKKVGSYAFYNSTREIKKLELPDSVEEIGWCAFARTSFYKGLEEIRLPKKLRSIGELAFAAQAVTSITIPENVESMEAYIFEDCLLLEKVIIKSKKIKKIHGCAFLHTNENLELYVPEGLEKKYRKKVGGIEDENIRPMKEK